MTVINVNNILYLNQYYKQYLLNDDLVSIKLKILIYCEKNN